LPLPNGFKWTSEQAHEMEQILRGNATEINKELDKIDNTGNKILDDFEKACYGK
jgi:hypothetical protein